MSTLAELLTALPDIEEDTQRIDREKLAEIFARLERRPIPTGSIGRLFRLGGLQAHVGASYLAYWLRNLFADERVKRERLLDTHLAAAYRILETMGYLRGAMMKVGQIAANAPNVLPAQIVDTLRSLHFEAPPMHYSLLQEHLINELGGPPEEVFAEFEPRAMAAASLGQVHRARLKTGEPVAVKIQYPGIARTIRSDLRNLRAAMFPLRLNKDWENMKDQLDAIREILVRETDYEQEARNLRDVRALFTEEDGVVVPRVHAAHSTSRVLTMDLIEGCTYYDLIQSDPSQEVRDGFGRRLCASGCRILMRGGMQYGDPHPGNFLFLDDGRVGLIDFGCLQRLNEEELAYMRRGNHAMWEDDQAVIEHTKRGCMMDDQPTGRAAEFLKVAVEYCRWCWEPFHEPTPFDWGDEEYVKRGIDLFGRVMETRYTRQLPINLLIVRWYWGNIGVMHGLGARVDGHAIVKDEARGTAWATA